MRIISYERTETDANTWRPSVKKRNENKSYGNLKPHRDFVDICMCAAALFHYRRLQAPEAWWFRIVRPSVRPKARNTIFPHVHGAGSWSIRPTTTVLRSIRLSGEVSGHFPENAWRNGLLFGMLFSPHQRYPIDPQRSSLPVARSSLPVRKKPVKTGIFTVGIKVKLENIRKIFQTLDQQHLKYRCTTYIGIRRL